MNLLMVRYSESRKTGMSTGASKYTVFLCFGFFPPKYENWDPLVHII